MRLGDFLELLFLASPSVDIDSGYYTVKFDSLLLKEAVVEGDSVIPPLRSEDGASSAESDEDSVDDSGYAKGKRGEGVSESDLGSRSAFLWDLLNYCPGAFVVSASPLMKE